MAAKPILYSYYRSSASWRVRIVLALKGIEYDYKGVSLVKDGGQQHSEEFKALNPMEQVPAYVVGDTCLTQSMAIIDYLEDIKPEPSIFPKDPLEKAQAQALSHLISGGTQPMICRTVIKAVTDRGHDNTEWAHFWIDKGLTAFEKMLQKTAGKYCVGDEVTIADICLVPQMLNASRFKVDLTKFPTINRIVADLSQLEAFKLADPSVQPDTPEDQRKA